MKEFIDYTFYGTVPEGLSLRTLYELYKAYCMVFDLGPLSKFDFYEEFKPYMN